MGIRVGHDASTGGAKDYEPVWTYGGTAASVWWRIDCYPKRSATWLTACAHGATKQAVSSAFKQCVFPTVTVQGARAARRSDPDSANLGPIRGEWAERGGTAWMQVRGLLSPSLRFERDGEVFVQESARIPDSGLAIALKAEGAAEVRGELIVRYDGSVDDESARIHAVFARIDATSSVPFRIDFERAPKAAEK